MSVYKKLNEARSQFHTLKLKKSGLNKFAGYSYFELADFLIPALEVFKRHDLCAYISFANDLATMRIVDVTDGTIIEITSPMSSAALKGCHEVQNLGAVQSYLRRYLWVTAMEIVEHDALDSSEGPAPKKDSAAPDITDHLLAIEGSGNSDELAMVYKDALEACLGNQALQTKVIAAKKARVERAKQEKAA